MHMFDKQDGQHLEQLLSISNLAKDVSHNRSVLTVKIFGAMTTRPFLTLQVFIKTYLFQDERGIYPY